MLALPIFLMFASTEYLLVPFVQQRFAARLAAAFAGLLLAAWLLAWSHIEPEYQQGKDVPQEIQVAQAQTRMRFLSAAYVIVVILEIGVLKTVRLVTRSKNTDAMWLDDSSH